MPRRVALPVTLTILLLLSLGAAWLPFSRANRASPTVAFLGDSITQGWQLPRENFGVYGQTTAQMLERFQRQIPGHGTVVILGGTNDTLLEIDPMLTERNLDVMIELAHRDGVEPVLAEIPPIYRASGRYQPAVDRLNERIVHLAQWRQVKLVDYHGALAGHPEAYLDDVHLKRRGYLRMEWALLRTTHVF